MRVNLKVFRIKQQLSLREMAEKIDCKQSTFAAIENGRRAGKQQFWNNLQKAFNLTDAEAWQLMKNDNTESEE